MLIPKPFCFSIDSFILIYYDLFSYIFYHLPDILKLFYSLSLLIIILYKYTLSTSHIRFFSHFSLFYFLFLMFCNLKILQIHLLAFIFLNYPAILHVYSLYRY